MATGRKSPRLKKTSDIRVEHIANHFPTREKCHGEIQHTGKFLDRICKHGAKLPSRSARTERSVGGRFFAFFDTEKNRAGARHVSQEARAINARSRCIESKNPVVYPDAMRRS
jgi:hypothetical protein